MHAKTQYFSEILNAWHGCVNRKCERPELNANVSEITCCNRSLILIRCKHLNQKAFFPQMKAHVHRVSSVCYIGVGRFRILGEGEGGQGLEFLGGQGGPNS